MHVKLGAPLGCCCPPAKEGVDSSWGISKAEHEYMTPVSTCGLICGKPVGIVAHRSKSLSDTGHYRSESANLKQQVLVTSTC